MSSAHEGTPVPGRNTGITVIDSMMGTGKTTWIIDHINQTYGAALFDEAMTVPKYLVVVPSLSEVERFIAACPALGFRDPQPVEGKKLWHLETLVNEGSNIVTTHALFSMLTPEISEKFKVQGYTLVIDEVLTTVDMFQKLSTKDRDALFKSGYVWIEDGTQKLRWNDRDHGDYSGRFDDIRAHCHAGTLVYFRSKMLIWEFPAEFLENFVDVYVCTYMFEGSPMAAYLRTERFPYMLLAVRDGELIPMDYVDESVEKAELRQLITIYEGPMNKVGDPEGKEQPLSSSWWKRSTSAIQSKVRASTENFFKKIAKTPAAQNLWTIYKPQRNKVKGARYARQWIANNTKATNDHIEKRSLAYLCNIHYITVIKDYFTDRGITVHEDLYALSEMIQWIWRSQIRRGDPITVFIPSKRMRELLKLWLNSSNTIEVMKQQQQYATT